MDDGEQSQAAEAALCESKRKKMVSLSEGAGSPA